MVEYFGLQFKFNEINRLAFEVICPCVHMGQLGHAVAQLVEALRYKPEGRGFDSRWCHWNFS
jgi:hypothetical protein